MDSGKAMASGVTIISPGASSTYHVAPRAENLGPGTLSMDSPMMVTGSEKKRGRPRKYKPDESVGHVFSPTPLSSAAPPASGKSYMGEKKPSLEQLTSSEKKQRNKIGAEKLG